MRICNVLASVVGFGLAVVMAASSQAQASIFIHEILADPPAVGGDANGDGVVSTSQDEFVELYNPFDQDVNLSGWMIADALHVRHVFPQNSWIGAQSVFVVFGGGEPTFDSSLSQIASTGSLSLNNSGDTVTLFDLNNAVIDVWMYGAEGGNDQSMMKIGDEIYLHTDIDPDRRFSPGEVSAPSSHAVPEPATLVLLGAGLVGAAVRRWFI